MTMYKQGLVMAQAVVSCIWLNVVAVVVEMGL